jgi:hypothetical protein
MDDYRGGKFIVGNDVRLSEQTRQAGEYLRNRGEDFRNGNEYTRNEIASRSIGAAENYSRSSFLTQIGMFLALLLSIIIIATIAGLAYNKAYNNTSLVNLSNLRDLTLSNLTVNDNSDLNTLNLIGDMTSIGGISTTSGLSVGGKAYFYDDFVLEAGLSINGGLSVGGKSNLYGDINIDGGVVINGVTNFNDVVNVNNSSDINALYSNLSINNISAGGDTNLLGGLSVGLSSYFDSDVFIEGGLSINGAGDIGVCHFIHGNLLVSGYNSTLGNIFAYQDVIVANNTQINNDLILLGSDISAVNANLQISNIYATGGLSVGTNAYFSDNVFIDGKAQLKKLYTKVITDSDINSDMTGLSLTGYNLSSSESGTLYLVSHGNNIEHTNIRFNLPSAVEAENYKFLWKNGLCYPDNKIFTLSTTSSENLYGTVSLNEDNSGNCYSIHASANPSSLTNATALTLNGVIYPGSVIECVSDGTSWFINSDIGISYLQSVVYNGAYKIQGVIDGVNVIYAFGV